MIHALVFIIKFSYGMDLLTDMSPGTSYLGHRRG